jgi:iron complex outermembrane receptor protein
MKLTILFVLLLAGQVLAIDSYSQTTRISVNMNNSTVKDVLMHIEKSSDYFFLYSNKFVDVDRRVDVNMSESNITDVLDELFRGTNVMYDIKDRQIILRPDPETGEVRNYVFQQPIEVTGVVVDDNGNPVPGATVVLKGTSKGTVTDFDGKFNIRVSGENPILIISFVGMEPVEIAYTGQGPLDVTLKSSTIGLDEVVAIGYGSMTRKDLTSSITSIKSDELNKGGVYSSPGQLLQGKVPGLTITTSSDPSSTPSVTLRGASTFRTGQAQEPYYVIDGIPGASISLVSPDDIESIDVLRDASATAIYGSKAANGVIIVTTKKGKTGQTNVTYNGYVAIDQVSNSLDMLTGNEHRALLEKAGKSLSSADYIGDNTTNTDWQDEVQRTGISYNHNISITGGSEKTTYSASVNSMSNEGIIKSSSLDRIIARTMLNTKTWKDHLELGFNLNGSITNNQTFVQEDDGLNVLDAMTYFLPESPVYDEDGLYFENLDHSQYYNPVALIEQNQYKTRKKWLQGVAKATLHILPELTFDTNLSYQSENITYSQYNDIDSKAAYNYDGYALRSNVENTQKSLESYFNYNKTFNDVHKVGAMLGYSWQENNDNDGFQVSSKGFSSDALSYYNMGLGYSSDRPDYGTYYYTTLRMISFFARVNYSFNSKYMLQATMRRDGSSAFGDNNRWGTFPSASFAWRMNDEGFIKNLNLFDDLKFRIGYGVSGNSLGFDPLIAQTLYGKSGTFVNSDGITVSAIGATRNANPDLKWERTSMFNVGLDFGFFKNRLTGTIEYYNKNTSDLIADYQVSTTKYLYAYMTANVGEISNKGVELSLNAVPVKTDKFSWNTTFNISHNKNNVESISNDNYAVDYFDEAELNAPGQSGSMQQRIIAGKPLGSFYTWKWAGYTEDGVSQFYTADDDGNQTTETTTTPTNADRFYTGNAQPKLTFGWNNTLTYKNWSMTMFFTGLTGNKIMNGTRARLSRMSGIEERNMLRSVLKTEKTSDYNSHYLSDRYLEKGDYIRLQTLSLSYDLKNVCEYVHNLRVYASCNNVFVITDYEGLDPEVNLGGLTPGIDNKNFYPKTRTFMVGASITF